MSLFGISQPLPSTLVSLTTLQSRKDTGFVLMPLFIIWLTIVSATPHAQPLAMPPTLPLNTAKNAITVAFSAPALISVLLARTVTALPLETSQIVVVNAISPIMITEHSFALPVFIPASPAAIASLLLASPAIQDCIELLTIIPAHAHMVSMKIPLVSPASIYVSNAHILPPIKHIHA
jgi:hypothetical protein